MFPIRILRRAGRSEMQFTFTSIEAVFALPSAAAGAVHQVTEERVDLPSARTEYVLHVIGRDPAAHVSLRTALQSAIHQTSGLSDAELKQLHRALKREMNRERTAA